jgi:hypothetical protein
MHSKNKKIKIPTLNLLGLINVNKIFSVFNVGQSSFYSL